MRISIATRLFLAITLVSLVILTINAVVTRWNFERGFLEYVAEQEADAMSSIVEKLVDVYQSEGSWALFEDNPRRWSELARPDSDEARPRRRPGPGARPERRPGAPPPPRDSLGFGQRTALLDANQNFVIGRPDNPTNARQIPIRLEGEIIGYISLVTEQALTKQIDQNFASKQKRSIYLIAIAALLFAAGISAVFARQLTRPIRALAAGTRSISAGKLETRIEATRLDELGDLATDFNRLARTLEQDRLSRQRWVADIAHELRTPLAILRGELDAIEDNVRTFDVSTRQSLQAEVSRLSALVNDLHELSIHDAGKLHLHTDTVDIAVLLDTALNNAHHRFSDAGIALTSQCNPAQIPMVGDATKLQQLFTNLLENTLRYTDSPGTLHVDCVSRAHNIVIEFSDSAPGVPDHLLERLFDRLFRVSESRSRDSGGSGLGLSICKAIVAAHHGTIEAINAETGGLLIRIQIPNTSESGNRP